MRAEAGGGTSAAAGLPPVRAGVFARLAVPLSVAAHFPGGGDRPGPALLAVAFLGSFTVHRAMLAEATASRLRAVVALGATQLILHALLSLSTPGRSPGGDHATHAIDHGVGVAAVDHLPGHAHPGAGTLAMVLFHAVAAVVLGLLLQHQEERLRDSVGRIAAVPRAVQAVSGVIRRTVLGLPAVFHAPCSLLLHGRRCAVLAQIVRTLAVAPDGVLHTGGGRIRRGPPRGVLADC